MGASHDFSSWEFARALALAFHASFQLCSKKDECCSQYSGLASCYHTDPEFKSADWDLIIPVGSGALLVSNSASLPLASVWCSDASFACSCSLWPTLTRIDDKSKSQLKFSQKWKRIWVKMIENEDHLQSLLNTQHSTHCHWAALSQSLIDWQRPHLLADSHWLIKDSTLTDIDHSDSLSNAWASRPDRNVSVGHWWSLTISDILEQIKSQFPFPAIRSSSVPTVIFQR